MSGVEVVVLAYIVGVCGAVAVACWSTKSAWPLIGLLFLGGIHISGGG